MRKHVLILICICVVVLSSSIAISQPRWLQGHIADRRTAERLGGARVKVEGMSVGAVSSADGTFRLRLDTGSYAIVVTMLGYQTSRQDVRVEPGRSLDTLQLAVEMESAELEGEEVVVSGTRTQRSIADVPVRVEAVPQEEVEEKILMRPASVSMLLSESPGVRVQNTSATSNTANIRIQGLDGRYTQLLVDGVPVFSGLGSGFGITQLIPLNLRQVEIVKGANSALYGADAIAGVINFITKEAREEPELSALVNATSQRGYDIAAFYGERLASVGVTALASFNHQERFDVNGDGFSDIAGFTRATFVPKVSMQVSENLRATIGGEYFSEARLGGVMSASDADAGKDAPYLERNRTERIGANLASEYLLGGGSSLSLKTAMTWLDRHSTYGATPFDASQTLLFGDLSWHLPQGQHDLLFGVSATGEDFRDETANIPRSRSYRYGDVGVWGQDEFVFAEDWKLLASLRVDRHDPLGTFLTPRASLFYKATSELTFRLGAGSGFKAPTMFLEDAELYGFKNARPLVGVRSEKAQSASFDANFATIVFGELGLKLNAALYSTWLRDALTIDQDSLAQSVISIRNVDGLTWTRGGELSAQFTLSDLKLSLNYVYLDSRQTDRGMTDEIELNPHHWLGIILMYENADAQVKAGVENYYTSPQHLFSYPGRTMSPDYSLTGFLIEKGLGNVRLFFNAENIFDIRQTRFGPSFTGDPNAGTFHPLHVFAPVEGRAVNAGLRFVLH